MTCSLRILEHVHKRQPKVPASGVRSRAVSADPTVRWDDELTAQKMKECVWLRPEAVARVEFLEWTAGDRLRHSKFIGLREGKDPKSVPNARDIVMGATKRNGSEYNELQNLSKAIRTVN